jgi:hypothetical protein
MSNQYVDFKHAGDTGERGDIEAIEPYSNDEPVSETVLQRPPENLRYRSEILRSETEKQLYLQDSDMRWVITQGTQLGPGAGLELPGVIWDASTGSFILTDDVVIQPLNTPSEDKKETGIFSFDDTFNVVDFLIETVYFDYEGANRLQIIWEEKATGDIPGGNCSAAFEGSPIHIIRILIRNDGLTMGTHVDAALTALINPAANGFYYNGFAGILGTFVTLANMTDPVAAPVSPYEFDFSKTFDREMHWLETGQVVDFFTGPPAKSLADGDTLSIYYPLLSNPLGIDGRRQATPGTGSPPPNTDVLASQLFITSENPEKIPLAIPLCKRIGDDLFWLDGTVVKGDAAGPVPEVKFGSHGYTGSIIFAEPTTVHEIGISLVDGVTQTFQITGNFYVGDGDHNSARQYFDIYQATSGHQTSPLVAADGGRLFISGLYKDAAAAFPLVPSVDAVGGFYENPYIKVSFAFTSNTTFIGNIDVWCCVKKMLNTLEQNPPYAFPEAYRFHEHHSTDVLVRDRGVAISEPWELTWTANNLNLILANIRNAINKQVVVPTATFWNLVWRSDGKHTDVTTDADTTSIWWHASRGWALLCNGYFTASSDTQITPASVVNDVVMLHLNTGGASNVLDVKIWHDPAAPFDYTSTPSNYFTFEDTRIIMSKYLELLDNNSYILGANPGVGLYPLFVSGQPAGSAKTRIYYDSTGSFYISYNCGFTVGTWVADDITKVAYLMQLHHTDGFSVKTKDKTSLPWSYVGGWDSESISATAHATTFQGPVVPSVSKTLLFESLSPAGLSRTRIYYGVTGQLYITSNAEWTEGDDDWSKDKSDNFSMCFLIEDNGFTFKYRTDSTGVDWTDSEWTNTRYIGVVSDYLPAYAYCTGDAYDKVLFTMWWFNDTGGYVIGHDILQSVTWHAIVEAASDTGEVSISDVGLIGGYINPCYVEDPPGKPKAIYIDEVGCTLWLPGYHATGVPTGQYIHYTGHVELNAV